MVLSITAGAAKMIRKSGFKPGCKLAKRSTGMIRVKLDLPQPISVNQLFINRTAKNGKGSGKGRIPTFDYKAWKERAANHILAQGHPHLPGPVELIITVREGRMDLSNTIKCLEDALVQNGVIDGDGPKIVRRIAVEWGDVEGAHIEIRPSWIARKIELRGHAA